MYELEVALIENKLCVEKLNRKRVSLAPKGLYIYGTYEDYSILCCENTHAELFEIPYNAI